MFERLQEMVIQIGMDVFPIALVVVVFQVVVCRRRPPHLRRILIGSGYMLLGLVLFRFGLEDALLPMGGILAEQLILLGGTAEDQAWYQHYWLLIFAGALGLAATLVEPTLIAIAGHVENLSGGSIRAGRLRLVVGVGMAAGLMLGTLRILVGGSILHFVTPLVLLAAVLCVVAPRAIVALALDTGPMATTVVTVPLITAFGVVVATTLPGRDPLLDGFGLVFFALLSPVISLLAYAWFQRLYLNLRTARRTP